MRLTGDNRVTRYRQPSRWSDGPRRATKGTILSIAGLLAGIGRTADDQRPQCDAVRRISGGQKYTVCVTAMRIRVGTSGWHYKHWRGAFYPDDLASTKWLAYYVARFSTVEVNNSFYKLLSPSAVIQWYEATPKDFLFAVKASRYITHNKRLSDAQDSYGRFFASVAGFKEKLGPILFQLPPHWSVNGERLEAFLAMLPPRHRYAFEFRDPSWHTEEIFQILARYNAAFCIYQLAGFTSPLKVTADFVYVRLHGPGGKYQGDYSGRQLARWAKLARGWSSDGKAVFVYFDNDQAGYAAKNAFTLQARLGSAD
jgi:uncharacterized protein YecE (DUF72 family)